MGNPGGHHPQEVDGSQAHPEPRMLRTSDEDLAQSKGFDERSFRMEKREKPNRKRGK